MIATVDSDPPAVGMPIYLSLRPNCECNANRMISGALPSLDIAAHSLFQHLLNTLQRHGTTFHGTCPRRLLDIWLRPPPKQRLKPPHYRKNRPTRKTWGAPNTKHDPHRQQHLCYRIRSRDFDQHPCPSLSQIPRPVPPPQFNFRLRLRHVLTPDPPLALEIRPKPLHAC